jgi:hypothetical protein
MANAAETCTALIGERCVPSDFRGRCAMGGSQQPISPMLPRYAEHPPARCRTSACAPTADKFAAQSGGPKVGAWRNRGCSQHVEKSSVVARGSASARRYHSALTLFDKRLIASAHAVITPANWFLAVKTRPQLSIVRTRWAERHGRVLLATVEDNRCALDGISVLVQPGLARPPAMHVSAKVTLQRNRDVRQRSENHRPRGEAGPYRRSAPRTPDHDPRHKSPASHRKLGDSRQGCHLSVK